MAAAGIAITIDPGQGPFGQRKNCSEVSDVVERDLIEDSVWVSLPDISEAVSTQDDVTIHNRLKDIAPSGSPRYTVDRIALETMASLVSRRRDRDSVPNSRNDIGRRAATAAVVRDFEDVRPEDSRAESC